MSENKKSREGNVVRIAGPLVGVLGMTDVRHFDVVHVGRSRLIGEVIQLSGDKCTVQVYEEGGGLRVGDRVVSTR